MQGEVDRAVPREELLGAVLDALYDPLAVFDVEGRIVTANPAMEALTGLRARDACGCTMLELRGASDFTTRHADEMATVHEFVLHVARTGETAHDDDSTRHLPDGGRVRISQRMTPVRAGDRIVGVVFVLRDLDRAYSTVFRTAGVGMIRLDWEGRISEVNQAFLDLVGRDEPELRGLTLRDVVQVEDRAEAARMLTELDADPSSTVRAELRFVSADGQVKWGSTSAAAHTGGSARAGRYTVVTIDDISERKYLEVLNAELRETERHLLDSLAWEASHDALTGLLNRRGFMAALEEALASPSERRSSLSLLFIDVDRFKAVNDLLGHAVGDAVLRIVGRRIKGACRGQDLAARLGGDEFTVLVRSGTRDTGPERVAERIAAGLAEPVEVDGTTIHVAASIGIARHGGDVRTASDLLREADHDMYRVKERR